MKQKEGALMNAQEIIAKADRGEGLTEEEIRVYREAVKPVKHTYGKYGTLAKKYLEEENVGKYWAIENLPEYLHGIDRQADELYETMYAKLSQDERKNKVWGTSIDRKFANEIDEFLDRHNITKVELIVAGYQALLDHYGPKNQLNKE